MSYVCVDIGASSTRFASEVGDKMIIPNNMVFLERGKDSRVKPRIGGDIKDALEVELSNSSGTLDKRVLVGSMAESYSATNIKPSLNGLKHKQEINHVSVILAVGISKLLNGLDDEIDLYIALPPSECKEVVGSQKYLEEILLGEFRVEFPKYKDGGKTASFTIKSLTVLEESNMSMLSFFASEDGKPIEENRKYLSGNVLSLDIGASTTDLAVIKNGSFLDKTGQTYRLGGNIVRDNLIDSVRTLYGFELPLDDAERTVAEGRLQSGSSYIDVAELVRDAKKETAQQVVQSMQNYFNRIGIPIHTIRAIVVSGGGSMKSQYVDESGNEVETTEPMSYFITEELKDICPNVEVISHTENPRLSNLIGLIIRANLDLFRKKQALK